MTPEVSVVVVNHRTATECAACLASLASAFEREAVRGEIVLVDCASGPEETARLAALSADVFLPLAENRGYSGGLNAGLARARGARLLLCNADVVFRPGALAALLEAVEAPTVGAAAPLAFWDAEGRLRLPPGDAPTFPSQFLRPLAGRWPALGARRFAAFARQTLRLWSSGGATRHLVGAVLAVRRDVLDRVGTFDERFLFEYEETEWEDRVRRSGLELRYVAEARIRHLWGRSASRSSEVAARREASRRLYLRMRYGLLGLRLLEGVVSCARPLDAVAIPEPRLPARPGAWLALSPNPSCLPFAGTPLSSAFCLPGEVARGLSPGTWYLRVFREEDGWPLETFRWEKTA